MKDGDDGNMYGVPLTIYENQKKLSHLFFPRSTIACVDTLMFFSAPILDLFSIPGYEAWLEAAPNVGSIFVIVSVLHSPFTLHESGGMSTVVDCWTTLIQRRHHKSVLQETLHPKTAVTKSSLPSQTNKAKKQKPELYSTRLGICRHCNYLLAGL